MGRLFLLFLLALSVVSTSASAADYYFVVRDGKANGITNTFSSAGSACSAWVSKMQEVWGTDWAVTSDGPERINDSLYSCATKRTKRNGEYYNINTSIDRMGDACPANSEYNPATGSCDAVSACKARAGERFGWGYKTPVGYVTNGGKHGINEYLSYEGCEATAGDFNCAAANDGSDYGYCKGIGTLTGNDAKTNDTAVGNTAQGTDPTKATDTTCGIGYTWSGTTCVKNPDKDPGTDPGTGGDTGTGTDPGTGGDTGSGGGGGGSSGGGSGSDGGTGTTPGTGDGSGTGTTPGDDGKDDEGEEGSDRKVSGTDCGASMACSGDAIDCAIAQQQKKTYCELKDNMDLSKGKSSIESDIKSDKYQLDEDTVDVSSGYFSEGTRWLPTSCPADQFVSLSQVAIKFDMRIPCEAAGILGHLLVALGAIFFAVYVGRAFGGE